MKFKLWATAEIFLLKFSFIIIKLFVGNVWIAQRDRERIPQTS